jgi:hypothetical protein
VGKDEVVSIHDPAGGCMERLSCSLGPHKQRRQLRSPVGWISTFNILLTLTGWQYRRFGEEQTTNLQHLMDYYLVCLKGVTEDGITENVITLFFGRTRRPENAITGKYNNQKMQ